MNVVIRRRAVVMGLVALAAAGFAAAYGWRAVAQGSDTALLLACLLALVALFHAWAWRGARTPTLVADPTGLRVRMGSGWVGLLWDEVERVDVEARGRFSDGRVSLVPRDPSAVTSETGWRARLGIRANRWVYDAPLVVPYGLTTTVSVVDVAQTLSRLADGRADVVRLDAEAPEPEPTVALTDPDPEPAGSGTPGEPLARTPEPAVADGAPHTAEPVVATAAPGAVAPEVTEVDVRETADEGSDPANEDGETADEGDLENPDDGDVEPAPSSPPAVAAGPARTEGPKPTSRPLAAVVSALRPGRREEVTMPVRSAPATMGMLALSPPVSEPEPLPEVAHLRRSDEARRRADDDRGDRPDPPHGNISLIIDATTDLTARAMRKRSARGPVDDAPVGTAVPVVEEPPEQPPLVIGSVLAEAREHLGLSVDDLAERTRIRPFVIESLEVDDFSPCGGDFYARGHLRMLARVLGIDPAPLLATYDERFATTPVSPRQVFDAERASGTSGFARGTGAGPSWGALVAAVLVLVLVWGIARFVTGSGDPVDDTVVPRQNAAGLGSPGIGNPPVEKPEEAAVRVTAVGGDSRVVVQDRYHQDLFRGVLADGRSRRLEGVAPLKVVAVDGGVVDLRSKGKDLGLMGEPGERSKVKIPAGPRDKKAGDRKDRSNG